MNKAQLTAILASALEVGALNADSSPENTAEWDSLGQLTIMSAIANATDGKSDDVAGLSNAATIGEILDLLEKEGLIQ